MAGGWNLRMMIILKMLALEDFGVFYLEMTAAPCTELGAGSGKWF